MTETMSAYEEVRESTRGLSRSAHEAWTEADRLADQKRAQQEAVRQDPELSETGRANRFAELDERFDSRIREGYEKAANTAAQDAEKAYLWSIPAPGKGSLFNTKASDSNESTAIRLETQSILARAQHRRDRMGDIRPAEDVTAATIREVLQEALKGNPDDPDTKIRYLGAIRAAKDTVGLEAVTERPAGSRYERYLAEHEELQRIARVVPVRKNSASNTIFSKPKRNVRGGIRGQDPGARRSADPAEGRTLLKRRGRHW